MDEVGEADLRAIVRSMVNAAKAGDTVAAREVLDRVIGKTPTRLELAEAQPPAMKLYGIGTPIDSV